MVRKHQGRSSFLRLELDQSHIGARSFGPSAGGIASSSAQEHSSLDIGVKSNPQDSTVDLAPRACQQQIAVKQGLIGSEEASFEMIPR